MPKSAESQHHGIHYYYSVAGMLLILLPARECVRCPPRDTLCAPGWFILFRQPSCVHEKEPQQAYGVSIQVGRGATACNYRYVVLPVVIPLHYHCITMITVRLLNSVLRLLYGTQCLAALVRSCFYWPMSGRLLFSTVVKFYCSDSF